MVQPASLQMGYLFESRLGNPAIRRARSCCRYRGQARELANVVRAWPSEEKLPRSSKVAPARPGHRPPGHQQLKDAFIRNLYPDGDPLAGFDLPMPSIRTLNSSSLVMGTLHVAAGAAYSVALIEYVDILGETSEHRTGKVHKGESLRPPSICCYERYKVLLVCKRTAR
jgi:hypothetical protein